MDNNTILNMDPISLIGWLKQEFYVEMPEEIITPEDMDNASKLLLKLSASYSYLSILLATAKRRTRLVKREGNKRDYEDMIDRKDAIQCMTDSVKQQYAAISRSVTIKIENNRELQMSGYIKH